MNFTFKSLNIHYYSELSPFLSLKNNVSISSSFFKYFSSSFIISSLYLRVNECFFNKFTSQVIKTSKTENEVLITCSTFKDISTSAKGSIFSFNFTVQNIEVKSCLFINISSTSNPGCFYIEDSSVKVIKCGFDSCYASNQERKYGNAYYCERCSPFIEYSYTISCSPTTAVSGDSAIALVRSKEIHVSYINSSKCCGTRGSSSVTIAYSTLDSYSLSYLLIKDPNDWMAIETWHTKESHISYAIVINDKSEGFIINNQDTSLSTLSNCTFTKPYKKLAYDIKLLKFNNCYIEDIEFCPSCSPIENVDELKSFNTFIEINQNCNKLQCKNTINYNNDYKIIQTSLFMITIIHS